MSQVNRSLDDPKLDDVDHALGRPCDPFGGYRNRYVIDSASEQADVMRASPWWREDGALNGMTWFSVTDEGRQALADHLESIRAPRYREYWIHYKGKGGEDSGPDAQFAESAAKAKYAAFLDVRDCYDCTFREFLGWVSSVEVARPICNRSAAA